MSKNPKLCIMCEHFNAEAPDHGYYPGDYESGYLECGMKLWKIQNTETNPIEYRKTMLQAETCEHFKKAVDK